MASTDEAFDKLLGLKRADVALRDAPEHPPWGGVYAAGSSMFEALSQLQAKA